jgi:hypothetical protein
MYQSLSKGLRQTFGVAKGSDFILQNPTNDLLKSLDPSDTNVKDDCKKIHVKLYTNNNVFGDHQHCIITNNNV